MRYEFFQSAHNSAHDSVQLQPLRETSSYLSVQGLVHDSKYLCTKKDQEVVHLGGPSYVAFPFPFSFFPFLLDKSNRLDPTLLCFDTPLIRMVGFTCHAQILC
jgi:hypothetical protein